MHVNESFLCLLDDLLSISQDILDLSLSQIDPSESHFDFLSIIDLTKSSINIGFRLKLKEG